MHADNNKLMYTPCNARDAALHTKIYQQKTTKGEKIKAMQFSIRKIEKLIINEFLLFLFLSFFYIFVLFVVNIPNAQDIYKRRRRRRSGFSARLGYSFIHDNFLLSCVCTSKIDQQQQQQQRPVHRPTGKFLSLSFFCFLSVYCNALHYTHTHTHCECLIVL